MPKVHILSHGLFILQPVIPQERSSDPFSNIPITNYVPKRIQLLDLEFGTVLRVEHL
jgi:hypothetical protein